MTMARAEHTATLLSDGKVLVAGGLGYTGMLDSAELYDPTTNRWAPAGTMPVNVYGHTATRLPNGKVLVAGGVGRLGNRSGPEALAMTALYDPSTNAWSAAGSTAVIRLEHTATLLGNGTVLVIGSAFHGEPQAEFFDLSSNTWAPAAKGGIDRYSHTATRLRDGRVLVAGGQPSGSAVRAQLYAPLGSSSRSGTGNTVAALLGVVALLAGALLSGLTRRTRRFGQAT